MPYDVSTCRKSVPKSRKSIPPGKIIAWIENNFEFKKRKGGEEYCIRSPFTNGSDFKFNINPEKGICHDWRGDDWAGPVRARTGKRDCSFVNFVKQYRKCSWWDALTEVLGSDDASEYLQSKTEEKPKLKVAVELPPGLLRLADSHDRQAQVLKKWLKSRGYTDERIDTADLRFSGMEVFWPYYEFDELVYWQSRSRLNKRFRFPDAEVFDKDGNAVGETVGSKGHFLYGFDEVDFRSYLIIVEAIFGQNTIRQQCVASGGAALTDQQINKIRIIGPDYIILSPDNDCAGLESAISNYKQLQQHNFKVFYTVPPKIKYTKDRGDGTVTEEFTKDWNELFEYCKMSLEDIRRAHDDGITRLDQDEVTRLQRKIRSLKIDRKKFRNG